MAGRRRRLFISAITVSPGLARASKKIEGAGNVAALALDCFEAFKALISSSFVRPILHRMLALVPVTFISLNVS
jgi:hypothetical protein